MIGLDDGEYRRRNEYVTMIGLCDDEYRRHNE